jgi:hypothetical protein
MKFAVSRYVTASDAVTDDVKTFVQDFGPFVDRNQKAQKFQIRELEESCPSV